MRREKVDPRAGRYDPRGIDGPMAAEVVALYVVEVYRRFDLILLKQVARVWPQVAVVDDAPEIRLEVAVVDGIEAHQAW